VPWRCHRSLIADALMVHGDSGGGKSSAKLARQLHTLTPFAKVDGTAITYPPYETPLSPRRINEAGFRDVVAEVSPPKPVQPVWCDAPRPLAIVTVENIRGIAGNH
jgi:hypothetical protein